MTRNEYIGTNYISVSYRTIRSVRFRIQVIFIAEYWEIDEFLITWPDGIFENRRISYFENTATLRTTTLTAPPKYVSSLSNKSDNNFPTVSQWIDHVTRSVIMSGSTGRYGKFFRSGFLSIK